MISETESDVHVGMLKHMLQVINIGISLSCIAHMTGMRLLIPYLKWDLEDLWSLHIGKLRPRTVPR